MKLFIAAFIAASCLGCSGSTGPAEDSFTMNSEEVDSIWQDSSAPGEKHDFLKELAGDWSAEITYWPEPGAVPVKSGGTARHTLILGGRFLQEEFRGQVGQAEFEGRGWLGYDNVARKYVSTWVDSLSTKIARSEGVYRKRHQRIEFESSYLDPVTKEVRRSRSVVTRPTGGKYSVSFFEFLNGGAEFKNLEIAYTKE